MYSGLHVRYPSFLSDFDEIWIFSTDFLKNTPISSNIKFHKNQSSGRQVVPCGRKDRQTGMKLIVAFHNSANSPKNRIFHLHSVYVFCIYLRINSDFVLYNVS